MRSDIRALIVSILMFLLWGTVLTYPYRIVTDLVCQSTEAIAGKIPWPAVASAVFCLIVIMGVTCVLLLLGRMEISEHLVLGLSILACVVYTVQVIRTRSFSIDAVFVALILSGALVLVILRKTEIARYVADAYIMALPVRMAYECVMNPLYRLLKADLDKLSPFMTVPSTGIFSKTGNMLGIPLLVWSGFFFIVTILPVIYLAGGRKEGKIKEKY
ncbi:MAG: hypothetical protein J5636_07775 [Clostridiales bacterium]|nr:hypothetical protein [Clostridiales bacterium]